jgi:glyoxylase-like metal-dependent hydrolase (beta-lactamase superfamily II)
VTVMQTSLEFRWLGVAGFELKFGGSILLVDPFLTRPPAYKLLFGRTRPDGALLRRHIPHADHILISHAHYDHLLDAGEIAGYSGGRVYGSENTCRIVEVCGLSVAQVVRVREGMTLTPGPSPMKGEGGDSFRVSVMAGEHTPVPVFGPGKLPERLHYPLRLRDFVMDEDFTFLIQAGGTRVLAWHHWRPSPAPRADVLVIGADIRLEELGELIDQVQPRLLIPTHWDNFLRPLSKPLKPFFRPPCPGHPLPERYDPWEVKRYVGRVRPGVEVWVPVLMKRIELEGT